MITLKSTQARTHDGAAAILSELAQRVGEAFFQAGYATQYAVPGKPIEIEMVLGGREECHAWDVKPEALGFFLLGSGPRSDDDEDSDTYFEVSEGFVVHVNLEKGVDLLAEDWADFSETDREAEIEAWVVTVVHELYHALEWIKETGGKSPDEVFCAGQGELALREVQQAVEDRLAKDGASEEDVIEARARDVTARLVASSLPAMRERLEAVLDRPSPRQR